LNRSTRKPISAFQVRGKGNAVGEVYWVNNERVVYTVTESHSWNKALVDNGELIGVNADGSKHKRIFGYQTGEKQIGTRMKKRKLSLVIRRLSILLTMTKIYIDCFLSMEAEGKLLEV